MIYHIFEKSSVFFNVTRRSQVSLRKAEQQKYWQDARDPELTKFYTWDQVMSSDQAVREFLVHFMVHGLVFLKDIPKGM